METGKADLGEDGKIVNDQLPVDPSTKKLVITLTAAQILACNAANDGDGRIAMTAAAGTARQIVDIYTRKKGYLGLVEGEGEEALVTNKDFQLEMYSTKIDKVLGTIRTADAELPNIQRAIDVPTEEAAAPAPKPSSEMSNGLLIEENSYFWINYGEDGEPEEPVADEPATEVIEVTILYKEIAYTVPG